jgi:hypothetical protein
MSMLSTTEVKQCQGGVRKTKTMIQTRRMRSFEMFTEHAMLPGTRLGGLAYPAGGRASAGLELPGEL